MLDPITAENAHRIPAIIPELAAVLPGTNGQRKPPGTIVNALAQLTTRALDSGLSEELLTRCFDVIEAVLEADEREVRTVLEETLIARLKQDEAFRQKAEPYMGGFLRGSLVDPDNLVLLAGGQIDSFTVGFSLDGPHLDPDEISRRLGVRPDRAHRRGDLRASGGTRFTRGQWAITSGGSAPEEIESKINELLDQLPATESWLEMREDYECGLSVGIFMDFWNRGFELSATTLRRIADMGLAIDFDIYCTPRDEDEAP